MIDRYTRPEMARLFTKQNRFASWLKVELAATDAFAELGVVPKHDAAEMRKNAKFSIERIEAIEKATRHDVVAFTRCVSESLGAESKYLHFGLTSTDVVDTALSSVLKEACDIIIDDIDQLTSVLKTNARKYKDQIMMGRTHGVHAEPTTLGLKFALWYSENLRNRERLIEAKRIISVGKISGAVGTYANVDPFVEKYVCAAMGIAPSPISTQTLQRDRHAQLIATFAIVASCLDKYATEIRGLQKTEIRELEEPFATGQKGSSAMPHKRNPINCEQISGLARVIRGYVVTALEDIPLWHERDISHSSAERVILADACELLDYMLYKIKNIIENLNVYPNNMRRNMDVSLGLTASQHVLLKLIERGMLRETAYDLVQALAMRAWSEQVQFRGLVEAEPKVAAVLTGSDIDECFNWKYHVKHVDTIFERLGLL